MSSGICPASFPEVCACAVPAPAACHALHPVPTLKTKLKAELLANALEYTSLNVRVEEFETAVTAALNEAKSQDEKRETAINAARETQ